MFSIQCKFSGEQGQARPQPIPEAEGAAQENARELPIIERHVQQASFGWYMYFHTCTHLAHRTIPAYAIIHIETQNADPHKCTPSHKQVPLHVHKIISQ